MAELTTKSINDLPDSDFAYIEPGGTKDAEGKTVPRSLRHFPIQDADHVRNALARAPQSPFGDKAMPKILAAAKKFGVEAAQATAGRADTLAWPNRITRAYALDDVAVRPGKLTCGTCGRDATGRIVDAYAGVFNQEAEIDEPDGRRYIESIDPAAWNRRLETVSRSRAGLRSVGVFYHHGKTLHDTPSESGSHPVGHPMAIRADNYGLLTSTHYGTTAHADSVFTDIVEGNLSGHSFTGAIYRSDPPRAPRAYRGQDLPKVRRLELGLDEYGPSPLAYYEGADLVGVRAGSLADPEPPAPQRERIEISRDDIVRKAHLARAQLFGEF